jgi:hypothetical protein
MNNIIKINKAEKKTIPPEFTTIIVVDFKTRKIVKKNKFDNNSSNSKIS